MLFEEAGNDNALAMLAGIYREAGQWRDLCSTLMSRAKYSVYPSDARDLRAEAARLSASRLGEEQIAVDLYERVLREDPGHFPAYEGLRSLLEGRRDYAGVIDLMERHLLGLKGEKRVALFLRLAEYEEQHLDAEAAMNRYAGLLMDVPNHLDALRGLEGLYMSEALHVDLLVNLERQLVLSVTPQQTVAVLGRIAWIHSKEFLNRELASETWERVLEIDPANDEALTELDGHYKELAQPQKLARIRQLRADRAEGTEPRVALLFSLAELYRDDLQYPEAALEVAAAIAKLVPDHAQTLNFIAELTQATGDAEAALDAIDKLAVQADDPQTAASHHLRAAALLEEQGNWGQAVKRYKLALEKRPGEVSTLEAFAAAERASGEPAAAVRIYEQALECESGGRASAILWTQIAEIWVMDLKDPEQAIRSARRALNLDEGNPRAHRLVADLSFEKENFKEAAEHFNNVLQHREALGEEELLQVLARQAEALAASGNAEASERVLDELIELSADNIESQYQTVLLTFERSVPERIMSVTRSFISRFAGKMSRPQKAQALYILGEATRRAGKLALATPSLREAADMNPESVEPLLSLARLYAARNRPEELEPVVERLLGRLAPEKKFDLWIEMAELSAGVSQLSTATKYYLSALAERPGEREVLVRLMELYGQSKDWKELLAVILELVDVVDDHRQQASYLHVASQLASRELGDKQRAMELLNMSLAADPTLEKALREAVKLHKELGDDDALEQLYESQAELALERGDSARALQCLDDLGDLMVSNLRVDRAIDVNEQALALDPSDDTRRALLAELYASDPVRYLSQAVSAQEAVLADDPYRPEAYRDLRRIYAQVDHADATWCVCQALTVIGRADPEEELFFKRHRELSSTQTTARLPRQDWSELITHPDADPQVSEIFALTLPALLASHSKSLRKLGHTDEREIQTEHDGVLVKALTLGAATLGMNLPRMFRNPDSPGGLSLIKGRPPAIVLGAAGLSPGTLSFRASFVAGSHLSYLNGGSFSRYLLASTDARKAWVLAATKFIAPTLPVPPGLEGPIVEALEALRTHLSAQDRDQLARPVNVLLKRGAMIDLDRWVNGIDLTADRAGLLVCGDLQSALAVIREAGDDANSLSPTERRQELLRYSVSHQYLTIRERLRVTISLGTPQ